MPNLLTLVSVGVNVRWCSPDGTMPVGTRGKITKILLWTDNPLNQSPTICIDWVDESGEVFFSGTWNLRDFCPYGCLIASFGLDDEAQKQWIEYNRKARLEGRKELW